MRSQIPRPVVGRSKASVQLARWCKAKRGRQAQLIAALGSSRTAVFYYCEGSRVPSLERARVIQRLTGIKVLAWRAS